MKHIKALILLFYIFSAPAVDLSAAFENESGWNKENITYGLALFGIAADWRTSRDMGRYYDTPNPDNGIVYREAGPLMVRLFGDRPSATEFNLYNLLSLSLLTYVQYSDSFDGWRIYINSVTAGERLYAVDNNLELGLELKF